jgi:hypothetical protein
MAPTKSTLVLVAFVMILTKLNFDPITAETDWSNIKAKVIKACYDSIRYEPKGSGEPTHPCCQALEHEDVDGICEHLNGIEEESVNPIKLVKVIRGCDHRFKPSTHKCGSKYDKSIDMCILLLCTSL